MDAKPMTHEALIDLIGELGRETWNLLDNSEESRPVGEPVLTVDKDCFDCVSAVLDKIDALPFEELGYILGTGAKLQAALKQTFAAEITALTAAAKYMTDEALRLRAERDALRARVAARDAALTWYAEQAEGCRKLGSAGDPARHALDRDGGKRARDVISPSAQEARDAE